jgi:hypothetical protein
VEVTTAFLDGRRRPSAQRARSKLSLQQDDQQYDQKNKSEKTDSDIHENLLSLRPTLMNCSSQKGSRSLRATVPGSLYILKILVRNA